MVDAHTHDPCGDVGDRLHLERTTAATVYTPPRPSAWLRVHPRPALSRTRQPRPGGSPWPPATIAKVRHVSRPTYPASYP